MLFAAKPVFAEEQLRIFRLRFTALKMTAAFLFCEKLYVPSVGCFTKPRNHRQISTGSIYFFDPGGTPLQAILDGRGLPGPGSFLVSIVRLSGLMICKL